MDLRAGIGADVPNVTLAANDRVASLRFVLRIGSVALGLGLGLYLFAYFQTGAWQCLLAAGGVALGGSFMLAGWRALGRQRLDRAALLVLCTLIPTYGVAAAGLDEATSLFAVSGALLALGAGVLMQPHRWGRTVAVVLGVTGVVLFFEWRPVFARFPVTLSPVLFYSLWSLALALGLAFGWRAAWVYRRRKSLRSRMFVAFVLLAVVPACAVSGSSIFVGYVNGRQQILKHLESIATLKEIDIKHWVHDIHTDLSVVLTDSDMVRSAHCLLTGRCDALVATYARETLQKRMQTFLNALQRVDEIFLMDTNGEVVVSTLPGKISEFRGLQDYFREGLHKAGTYVQTLSFSSTSEGASSVVAVQPVRDADNKVIGVLCGRVSLKPLNELMNLRSGLGGSGETYLVGANRVLLTESLFKGFVPGRSFLQSQGLELALAERGAGYAIYDDYRSVPVLGVYRWIPDLKVVLLAELDVAEALQPVYATLYVNALLSLIAMCLAGLASFLYTRSITAPLEQLAGAAARIAAGELHVAAEISATTEVGALARAFNAMTRQLARRLEVENVVAAISRRCITLASSHTEEAILAALHDLGNLVAASRCFVYLGSFSSAEPVSVLATEDLAPAALAEAKAFFHGQLPWLRDRLLVAESVCVNGVETLPVEAAAERLFWSDAGAKVRVPLAFGGRVHGVLGLEGFAGAEPLSPDDLRALRLVAEIVGNALGRNRIEVAVVESEERFRAIFEQAAVGMALVSSEGLLLRVNQKLCDILGFTRDGLRNTALVDFSPERESLTDAEALRRMFDGGLDSYVAERRFLRRDRSRVWVGLNVSLVRDAGGAKYFIAVIEDISERVSALEALDAAQTYLKNILDSMPSAIVGVDSLGRVTHWNRAAADLPGARCVDGRGLDLSAACPRLAKQIEQFLPAVREGRPAVLERQTLREGDEVRYEDVLLYPLATSGDQGMVVRVDDATDRVRLEEMMIQSEKMMSVGGLAAGMAHEINNPLSGMLQSVQVVQMYLDPGLEANQRVAAECGLDLEALHAYLEKRKALRFLQGIQDSGQRAAKIVANMLEFSRRSESKRSFVDLNVLVDKAVELAASDYDLRINYDFRRVEIVRDCEAALPATPCAALEIEQVLLNLLKNAAQAMARDTALAPPRITLRTRRESSHVRIEVEDNGPGMSESVRKRVFEPFFTTKPPGQGTGLGLSVSYFIVVTNHKGTMSVVSAPGKGTTFIVRLPVG